MKTNGKSYQSDSGDLKSYALPQKQYHCKKHEHKTEYDLW